MEKELYIFNGNGGMKNTALLNWRTNQHFKKDNGEILMFIEDMSHNMIVMSESYIEAARILCLESINATNYDARYSNDSKIKDSLIFPIIYNLNHGLELSMKAIITILEILNLKYEYDYDCAKKTRTHNLQVLWQCVKEGLEMYGDIVSNLGWENYIEGYESEDEMRKIKKYINSLYNDKKVDKNLTFVRYPYMLKNGEEVANFYLLSHHEAVNLEELIDLIESSEFLNRIYYCLLEGIDDIRENSKMNL